MQDWEDLAISPIGMPLPALEKAASDAEPLIAEHARWAMQEIESSRETPNTKQQFNGTP